MKKLYLAVIVVLLFSLVGCQSGVHDIPHGTQGEDLLSGDANRTFFDYSEHSPPPEYIGVRSLAQLEEMRAMIQCTEDGKLNSYLASVEGAGAKSRKELIAFVDLIDSIPIIELIDGDIHWVAHFKGQGENSGEDHGTVFVSTMAPNGDWTRLEYRLSVKDVPAEIEKMKSNGEITAFAAPDIIQSNNGRIRVYSGTREAHPSGKGEMRVWIVEIDGLLARAVYYTSEPSDVPAEHIFSDARITSISSVDSAKDKG